MKGLAVVAALGNGGSAVGMVAAGTAATADPTASRSRDRRRKPRKLNPAGTFGGLGAATVKTGKAVTAAGFSCVAALDAE